MIINYTRCKFIARPGTWFKSGIECFLDDCVPWFDGICGTHGKKCGSAIFKGIRVCENNPNEIGSGHKPGDEREDGELCGLCEFDIYSDEKLMNNG